MISIQPWMPTAIGLTVLFFWFLKEVKAFLFWTYLWQLKNYHIGRFLAHFDTYNGRKIIYNWNSYFKYFAFFCLLVIFGSNVYIYPGPLNDFLVNYGAYALIAIPLIFLIYIIEGLAAFWGMIRRRIKSPQITSKISFLLPIIFIPLGLITVVMTRLFIDEYLSPNELMVFSLITFGLVILTFDILTPLIVSSIILLLQPITVILRNRTIKKAIKKRESLENLLVIGITGSYGKSSVKEFLKFILSKDFKVVSTEKNENSEMGISQCILNQVNEEHEIFICEMGAYNRAGIKLLADIAKPKIGILTGINNQHLATFGSQKNIIKAKFELINSLPQEGLAVLNWDNEFIRNNFKSEISSIKYSVKEKEDVWAEDIKGGKEGISFKVVFKTGESQFIRANINGVNNIPNLLAAIAVAKKLGMDLENIAERVEEIDFSIGGMKLKKFNGFNVIDATYSSNIDGIVSHLEYLKNWENKKIIVMPCLIELGSEGKEAHINIGKKIGEVCDLAIITSKDYFNDLRRGAVESGMKKENIIFIEDGEKILKKISVFASEGDVVLLESRVPLKVIGKLLK
ncbi:MAG: UDP-N-acetylmuramoyl-tripeptide--D-alanyl-D-alanine ligase [Candidatus Paceibacterota bacterium]|jgi:UDP-N-acetylmuramoyl-tripeptide--D-alanyl-D-alanine ligase